MDNRNTQKRSARQGKLPGYRTCNPINRAACCTRIVVQSRFDTVITISTVLCRSGGGGDRPITFCIRIWPRKLTRPKSQSSKFKFDPITVPTIYPGVHLEFVERRDPSWSNETIVERITTGSRRFRWKKKIILREGRRRVPWKHGGSQGSFRSARQ